MIAKGRRRAVAAVELLFVLPVLLTVLLGTVELSLWLTAQQTVSLSSREGARTAALGGDNTAVQDAVRLTLGDARYAQATVVAYLTDDSGNPVDSGQPVSVVVQLPVSSVVPDLLAFTGLTIRNLQLVGQTVMRKE
ncbi:MAG: hypothetical protein EBV06_10580 [Planctomycetia bacterium]|nr:hypothetical protein [Planctomycetia bacterium]